MSTHDNNRDGLPLFRNLTPEGRKRLNWYKHTWLYLDRYTGWAKAAGNHPGKGVHAIAWHGGVSVTTARKRLKKMKTWGVVTYDREYGWAAVQSRTALIWAESL